LTAISDLAYCDLYSTQFSLFWLPGQKRALNPPLSTRPIPIPSCSQIAVWTGYYCYTKDDSLFILRLL